MASSACHFVPLVGILFVGLVLAGCLDQTSTDGSQSLDEITVDLNVGSPESLYAEGLKVTLIVRVSHETSRVVAGVRLDPQLTIVSGDWAYDDSASPEDPIVLEGVVQAPGPGEYELRGWTERWASLTVGRAAPSQVIEIRGSAEDAEVVEGWTPEYAYEFSLNADPEDPYTLRANLTSPISVNVRTMLYPPTTPTSGEVEWAGRLAVGIPVALEWTLDPDGFRPGGKYDVHLEIHPHPSIDGRTYGASQYYEVSDGHLRTIAGPESHEDHDNKGTESPSPASP